MLMGLEERIANFIRANGLCSVDRILLAVSGGADSTALMEGMYAIKREGIFTGGIFCAHINHQLRGEESDGDEAFVVWRAGQLNLPVVTRRVDVRGYAAKNKMSIETAGRELRIGSLTVIAKANGCRWIATGHHGDDNAETILQRLVRGTGFRGLCGIWAIREFRDGIKFLRPLLAATKIELEEYLKGRNLEWRADKTNVDCNYRRNFIRHQLLPELQKGCENTLSGQLGELAEAARRFYDLICRRVDVIWAGEAVWAGEAEIKARKITVDIERVYNEAAAVKVEIFRRSLVSVGCPEGDLREEHFEAILELADKKKSGKRIELPGGFEAYYEYGKLIFRWVGKAIKNKETTEKGKEINVPGQTRFGDYAIETSVFGSENADFEEFKRAKDEFVEWFDFDKVHGNPEVRFRRAGDKFRPLGQSEEKRVGKFLTAGRVPREKREKAIVLADSEGIMWVWPIRASEVTKVKSETKRILQVKITRA
jgi:tRNA(Ile)-lysidine synthase